MACGACVKTITNAVKSVDQTAQIEADPKTKQVAVETDSSEAAVKEAIEGAGYAIASNQFRFSLKIQSQA